MASLHCILCEKKNQKFFPTLIFPYKLNFLISMNCFYFQEHVSISGVNLISRPIVSDFSKNA